MKGNKALGDRQLLCVHRLAWNLSVAAKCCSQDRAEKSRLDFSGAPGQAGLGSALLRVIPISW